MRCCGDSWIRLTTAGCGMLAIYCFIASGCGRSPSHNFSDVNAPEAANYELPLQSSPQPASREIDTVGLVFCLDVSGSMESDVSGKRKIDISKEAMRTVFEQVEAYVKSHPEKKVQVGLVSFSGGATLVMNLQPFDKQRLERETDALKTGGGTAIGDAMVMAMSELHKSGVESRAIIVMTDGENNRGIPPELVMQAIRGNRNTSKTPTDDVSVFLVAFDVNSSVFQGVSSSGASVVESRDANSLKEMLNTVVEEVLLEKQ